MEDVDCDWPAVQIFRDIKNPIPSPTASFNFDHEVLVP